MSYDEHHRRVEVLHRVLKAAGHGVIDDVAGHADYKEISQSFVKDDFRTDAGVRTTKNRCKGVLFT